MAKSRRKKNPARDPDAESLILLYSNARLTGDEIVVLAVDSKGAPLDVFLHETGSDVIKDRGYDDLPYKQFEVSKDEYRKNVALAERLGELDVVALDYFSGRGGRGSKPRSQKWRLMR